MCVVSMGGCYWAHLSLHRLDCLCHGHALFGRAACHAQFPGSATPRAGRDMAGVACVAITILYVVYVIKLYLYIYNIYIYICSFISGSAPTKLLQKVQSGKRTKSACFRSHRSRLFSHPPGEGHLTQRWWSRTYTWQASWCMTGGFSIYLAGKLVHDRWFQLQTARRASW